MTPTFTQAPLPEAAGGSITQGVYELVEIVVHELKDCFPPVRHEFAQILRLADGRGWLSAEQPANWNRGMTFTYATSGSDIAFDFTCGDPAAPPDSETDPLGPYETYTATGDAIILFSPSCGYHAVFERIAE